MGRLPGKSGFGPGYSRLLPASAGYSRGVTEPAGPAGSCRDLIPEFAGSSRELVPGRCVKEGNEVDEEEWQRSE